MPFDTPNDLIRFDGQQAHRRLKEIKTNPGKSAVIEFLSKDPTMQDYMDLVHHSLAALTIYNEVIMESATGPNPSKSLETTSYAAAGNLKEMRVAFDRFLEHYGFLADYPS